MTASIGGWLLVLALALPAVGVLLAIGAGGRWPERIALVAAPVGFVVALAITIAVLRSGDAVTYVLGGWLPPIDSALFNWIPGWIWLGIKVFCICTLFLWVRASFPRYRYDQIMRLGWKIFIPVTLVWLVVVGLWIQSPWNIWK